MARRRHRSIKPVQPRQKRLPAPPPASPATIAWRARHPARAVTEAELGKEQALIAEKWSYKNQGTPPTHEHAERTKQGALARLYQGETINIDQLQWGDEIATIAESIASDVTVRTASLETRIDQERWHHSQLVESIGRVRREQAYNRWRDMLPIPKRLVLDMIIGDAIGYTVAARRYKVHNRKAKKLLIAALDRWPECLAWAGKLITPEDVLRKHAEIQKG